MKRRLAIGLLVLAAIGAASIAYAAIPAANGVISGCVDKTGALKLIDAEAGVTCGGGKQLVAWNKQGPAGPQGPQGPQGPAGPPGLSDAYFTEQGANTITLNPDAGPITLLSLELPAGYYLVFATVSIFKFGVTQPELASCYVEGGAPVTTDFESLWIHPGDPEGRIALIGPATLVRQGYLKVACNSSVDAGAYARINALRVAGITEK